jgi:hypothetical protein
MRRPRAPTWGGRYRIARKTQPELVEQLVRSEESCSLRSSELLVHLVVARACT